MVKIIDVHDVRTLVEKVGIRPFLTQLIATTEDDFGQWQRFTKYPRHATHYEQGVIELMPIANDAHYAFKYVNGHPRNPESGLLTVMATGQLSDAVNGYPLMISEMTLLTAFRTAATSALAAKYLAKSPARSLALIGTGAQAEFQALAFDAQFGLDVIRYFDVDPEAMEKFARNLEGFGIRLQACSSTREAIEGVDIITTATASKRKTHILEDSWIQPGVHINGIGGDCPGKTELDPATVRRAKVVIEFLDQTLLEGEIQNIGPDAVYGELWEIVTGAKPGRVSDDEVTLFDSVGFALEDYSVLRYVYELAQKHGIGRDADLVPETEDPKDLFVTLTRRTQDETGRSSDERAGAQEALV